MENIIDTLIFDRAQADVERAKYLNGLWDARARRWLGTQAEWDEWTAGPRGAYGWRDLNRVTRAVGYLAGKLSGMGYTVDMENVVPAYVIRVAASTGGTAAGGGTLYKGDVATVTAQPEEKYVFVCWMEGGASTAPKAVVDLNTGLLTLSTPNGLSGPIFQLDENGVLSVKSTEHSFKLANGWLSVDGVWGSMGEVISTEPIYTFTVERSLTLTAVFALKQFQVDVGVYPDGSGEARGGGKYDIDTEVTVAAMAGDGYAFARWTENGETVAENPEYVFTLDRDRVLRAVMSKTYTISATVNPDGGGMAAGSGTFVEGQTVTVTAMAGDGYEFSGWQEDGGIVSEDTAYSFPANRDRELVAMFIKTYVVTLMEDPTGWGTTQGGGVYRSGERVTITAAPRAGYRFTAWTLDGERVSTLPSYSFFAYRDLTFYALFEELPIYTVTASIEPSGSGTVTGAGQYREGESVTLKAAAADGYIFSKWRVNGQDAGAGDSYTFTVTGDVEVAAVFETAPLLPIGYTEVEYIQTLSGGKYRIDTGVSPNSTNGRIEMVVRADDSAGNGVLFGGKASSGSYNVFIGGTQISYRFTTTIKTASLNVRGKIIDVIFDAASKTLAIGDKVYSISITLDLNNLILFNYLSSGTMSDSSLAGRIYSCKVYNGESLVRDLVPCVNPSGTVGLYDLVGKTFYGNSLAGALTAGPAV